MVDLLEQLRILKNGLAAGDGRLEALFSSSDIGVCVIGCDGKFEQLNPAWEQCLGHRLDGMLGRRVLDYVHPDDRRPTEAAMARVETEETVRYWNRFRQSDGRYRTLHWVATLSGGGSGICATVRAGAREFVGAGSGGERSDGDAASAAALGATPAELYRRVIETSPDAIIVTELTGRVLIVNEQAAIQNGLDSPGELIGLNAFDFIAPEDRARAAENARLTLETGGVRDVEYEILRRDGVRISVELNASLIRDADGVPRGFIANVRDITGRKRAAAALREEEEKYRILYQDNPSMYFTVDADGVVLSVNQFGAEQLGYTVEELLGKPVLDVIIDEDKAAVAEQLEACLAHPGELHTWEFRKRRKDERVIWVKEAARTTRSADGQPIILIVCEDITEAKQAEDRRRVTEERYRSLVETTPSAITLTDINQKIVICNRQAVVLHGFGSTEEMIGINALDLVAPEERDEARRQVEEAFRQGMPARGEYTLLRADGSRFPAEVSASVLADAEGRPAGYVAVMRDITRRRERENALRASEERYRILYQDNPSMYFTVDASGKVLSVNEFGAEQLGYGAEELVGKPVRDIFHAQDRKAVSEQLAACVATPGEMRNWEFRKVRKDGRVIWVKEAARATKDANGETIVLIVCEDITERKAMEEERQRARETLERKVERKMKKGRAYGLTFREMTVLHLVTAGHSDREIATTLGISPLTVSKHVANVLTKMGASSRSQASARAVREALID
jgi:PAS domain S-box-containing protein